MRLLIIAHEGTSMFPGLAKQHQFQSTSKEFNVWNTVIADLCNSSYSYTKWGKGKWKLLPKIEEITVGQAHKNTRKLNQNILTSMAVFLNQKRANVCEHMTKMVSLESLWKVPPEGCERNGWREFLSQPVEIFRLSFCVFVCACPAVTSSIFGKSFHFPFPYFIVCSQIHITLQK